MCNIYVVEEKEHYMLFILIRILGEWSHWIDEKGWDLNIVLHCGMCKLVRIVVAFKERVQF